MAYIGLGAVLLFLYRRNSKMQLKLSAIMEYLIVCVIFAMVGARLLFVIAMIPSMKQVTLNEIWFQLWNGGIVFYGGLFGVISGIIIVSKYRNRNSKDILNIVIPAVPLFHTFARIGCLLSGCCYGIEWNWGVIMADEPEVIRFPVQFAESICNLFIFIVIMLGEYKRKTSKYNSTIYFCSYAFCRFILEFFRGDQVRGVWLGELSTAQYISLIIIVVYARRLAKYLYMSGSKRKHYQPSMVDRQ